MIEKIITEQNAEAGLSWFMQMVGKGVQKYGKVRVTIGQSSRSLQQNALMWRLLTIVSQQATLTIWDGVKADQVKADPDDWKAVFAASLTSEQRVAKGLNGGRVYLSRSTRKMTVSEMNDLIELIFSYCAENQIKIPAENYAEWSEIK